MATIREDRVSRASALGELHRGTGGERILLQDHWEPYWAFPQQWRLSVQVCTSASAHGNVWADRQGLLGRAPSLLSSLPLRGAFVFGFCRAWGK